MGPDRRATSCSRCSARRRPRSSRRTSTTSLEATVISELAIDSLGMLEIIGSLERQLRIQIPDESLAGHSDRPRPARRGREAASRDRATSWTGRSTPCRQATNLKEELRALVAEIAEKDEIPDGATFKDLGIDSMMGVEIVAAIERQYQIKIDDDELAGFKDLDGAYALVVKKLEAKGATAAAE